VLKNKNKMPKATKKSVKMKEASSRNKELMTMEEN